MYQLRLQTVFAAANMMHMPYHHMPDLTYLVVKVFNHSSGQCKTFIVTSASACRTTQTTWVWYHCFVACFMKPACYVARKLQHTAWFLACCRILTMSFFCCIVIVHVSEHYLHALIH